jgi:hypothetical protein
VHILAFMLTPLRQILARVAVHFPKSNLGQSCASLLHRIQLRTFSTWPTDKLGYFQADPTTGETHYVDKILKSHSFDALLLNYICLTPLLLLQGRNPHMKRLVLAHDVWHKRAFNLKEAGISPDLKEWSRDEEAQRYKNADKVIGISWDENPLFIDMLGMDKVMTLPKAIQPKVEAVPSVEGRCLFVGKDMPTNLDGLNWFLNDVWPMVLKNQPQATFHICGSICDRIINVPAGVRLCGIVDDLAEQYGQATVVVIPIRTGSGVKIKLTEAVEFQRCCVSTRCGMEGLPAKEESGILVADQAQDFAEHVCTLLRDADIRRICLETTTKWASRHLHKDACYGPLVDFFKS